jgi:hypothetical protein
MYKGINNKGNLNDVKLAQTRCQKLSISTIDLLVIMLVVVMKGVFQQLIACNKLVVVMKGVF